jgi:hypothetical protein
MRKTKVLLTPDRDLPMLVFLWKWKIASTRILHARFYSGCNLHRTYNRLRQIEQAGYIEVTYHTNTKGLLWSLTANGFHIVEKHLPRLDSKGFKSEYLHHDLICASFHLGEWLCHQPKNVVLFSEQQLRTYSPSEYPAWVPQSKAHRPDGYTMIQTADYQRVVSIEVELSRKSIRDYRAIGLFYAQHKSVNRVLWLVNSKSYADKLASHLRKSDPHRAPIHNFVLFSDFRKFCWQAHIIVGPDYECTIRDFFNKDVPREHHVNNTLTLTPLLFFDTRKSQGRLTTSPSKENYDSAIDPLIGDLAK